MLTLVDDMTKKRHDIAVQKVGPGPDHMPIGEFGGAAALPGDGSPFLSAPMYWLYEMGHAALQPAGLDDRLDDGRRRARAGAYLLRLGTAVLPPAAIRAHVRAPAEA